MAEACSDAVRRKKARVSDWDAVEATPSVSRWDATPGGSADATPGRWDATPGGGGSRWDATPGRADGATPARKNRWDETPTPGRVRLSLHLTRKALPPLHQPVPFLPIMRIAGAPRPPQELSSRVLRAD